MILQSYLHKEGAPQYSDTGERLSKNMKTGFEQQRREAGLAREELWSLNWSLSCQLSTTSIGQLYFVLCNNYFLLTWIIITSTSTAKSLDNKDSDPLFEYHTKISAFAF